MEVGTEDEELSMIRMNLQPSLDLQSTLLDLTVNQVILGLLVDLVNLRVDHVQKELYL